MARTINLEHRAAIVDAVADRFIAAGTASVSLRGLADDIGVSARMLIHHFGSREHLVDTALEVARERQLAAARAAIGPGPDALVVLKSAWSWFRRNDTRSYFALFTDVAASERARKEEDRLFADRFSSDWRRMFEGVFGADERVAHVAPDLALLTVGVLRGFALDLADAKDLADHERAYALLISLVAARRNQLAQGDT